jgi:hypothetical protein
MSETTAFTPASSKKKQNEACMHDFFTEKRKNKEKYEVLCSKFATNPKQTTYNNNNRTEGKNSPLSPVTSQGLGSGPGTRIAPPPTPSSSGKSACFRSTDPSAACSTCSKLTCFARFPSLVFQPLRKLHSISSSIKSAVFCVSMYVASQRAQKKNNQDFLFSITALRDLLHLCKLRYMHIQQTQELSVVVVVSFFFLSLSLSAAVSVHATPHTRKAQTRASERLITAPENAFMNENSSSRMRCIRISSLRPSTLVHYLLFWYFVVMDERHRRSSPDCRRLPRKRMKERKKKERTKFAVDVHSYSFPLPPSFFLSPLLVL